MFEKLFENYGDFHDALPLNIEYKTNIDLSNNLFKTGIQKVVLNLSCYNLLLDYSRETIKIEFDEVEEFRFIKYDRMILDTFKEKTDEFYTIDFDPIMTSGKSEEWITKLNQNSMLSIKFKKLNYEKI